MSTDMFALAITNFHRSYYLTIKTSRSKFWELRTTRNDSRERDNPIFLSIFDQPDVKRMKYGSRMQ